MHDGLAFHGLGMVLNEWKQKKKKKSILPQDLQNLQGPDFWPKTVRKWAWLQVITVPLQTEWDKERVTMFWKKKLIFLRVRFAKAWKIPCAKKGLA